MQVIAGRIAATIAGVLALGLVALGCTETATESKAVQAVTTAPLVAGSTITVGGATLTLNEIVDPFTSGNQFIQPAAGTRFVAVDVTVTNVSEKPYTYNTLFDWKAQVGDATTYSADTAMIGALTPFLGTGTLPGRGDTARGWVGFAVKADQPLAAVQFKSLMSTNQGAFKAP